MTKFQSELLNNLLSQELALGNQVVDDGTGWGKMKRLVMLQKPFRSSLAELASVLVVTEVNDPHYWKTEVEDTTTNELLACRFE